MATEARTRRRRWLRLGVELLVILALLFAVRAWMQRDLAHGEALDFSAHLLDDTPVQLAEWHREEPLLLYVWASWCRICRLEQGTIERLAAERNVLTVAMQSGDDAEVIAYQHEHGLHFPVVNDPDGRLAAAYGARVVPAFFVIDRNGMIRFTEVGYTTGWGLRLRLWWAGLY